MTGSAKPFWIVWGVGAVAASVWLGGTLMGEDRSIFVPGATTSGHHQIEIACDACHTGGFAGRDEMQAKCESCHLGALDEARDSHPKSKFTDPRNADRVALLDARYCVTCHVEHRPERTRAMGLTIPEDYCVLCHEDIAEERPTHADLGFDSCASSGCHNFHDNRSIYEDYLLRHADAPELLTEPVVDARNFRSIAALLGDYPRAQYPLVALGPADADAPDAESGISGAAMADWAASSHAAAGVNCTACHGSGAEWLDSPGYDACRTCHTNEWATFVEGRHGMRLDRDRLGVALAPMSPADARLPMKVDPADDSVDCGSCHASHRFDTDAAAVESCIGCHDDEHSQAYFASPHFALVERARAGDLDPEAAVTCATCHMPRTSMSYDYGAYIHVLVQHNQSDNLTPNDKMLRSVCQDCHGLGFGIDALADRDLIERNFRGRPASHVPSIDLALERRRAVDEERQRASRSTDE